ncbi:MAG: ribbon-helix-helix domain-containing protein [Pyrobaculum sp.]
MGRKGKVTSVRIPPEYLMLLDLLVEKGRFNSRSEAVRLAVLQLLRDFERLGLYAGDATSLQRSASSRRSMSRRRTG